jgi:hypothetical protein
MIGVERRSFDVHSMDGRRGEQRCWSGKYHRSRMKIRNVMGGHTMERLNSRMSASLSLEAEVPCHSSVPATST